MRPLLTIVFLLYASLCFAQKAQIIKLSKLTEILERKSDAVQVINFWATWCGPCIKELPLFEKLFNEARPGVSITLVSMDLELDPNPDKVFRFIERKKIQSPVVMLDEKDSNSWISKIDPAWSGALPATLIINQKTGKREFVEKELHEGDLEKLIAAVQ